MAIDILLRLGSEVDDLRANFRISIKEKGERERVVVEKHNVVTNNGRDLIRQNLFVGGTARQLGWLHFGDINNGIENPLVERLDVDRFQTRWDGMTLVDGGIDCVYQMGEDENNGLSFNAAGIYTGQLATSSMYALAVFPRINKTDTQYATVTWQLRWRNYYEY
jgi:hypothetical protein